LIRRALDQYPPAMDRKFWMIKQEPAAYSWNDFVRDQGVAWTGVRNYQARNNLRAMKQGDWVAFYHSVSEKQVVGIGEVKKEAYADPTATEGDWSCVDLVPIRALPKPVGLEVMRADKILAGMPLIRHSRLSVMPLSKKQFERLIFVGSGTPNSLTRH